MRLIITKNSIISQDDALEALQKKIPSLTCGPMPRFKDGTKGGRLEKFTNFELRFLIVKTKNTIRLSEIQSFPFLSIALGSIQNVSADSESAETFWILEILEIRVI